MKKRTEGHESTTISGDTRADWSEAFELVPSLEAAYVWHASKFTREVLDGLLRIGFLHDQQIIWDKGRIVVYEPFLGSGTTLAAAEVTERVCFGIELDPKYADVVVQRWQQLTGNPFKSGNAFPQRPFGQTWPSGLYWWSLVRIRSRSL